MCVSLCYMERRARALDTDPLSAASCGRPPPEGVARLWIRDPMKRSRFFDESRNRAAPIDRPSSSSSARQHAPMARSPLHTSHDPGVHPRRGICREESPRTPGIRPKRATFAAARIRTSGLLLLHWDRPTQTKRTKITRGQWKQFTTRCLGSKK